jgi:predicted Fe-S protein YdhL (DUF1289 family)
MTAGRIARDAVGDIMRRGQGITVGKEIESPCISVCKLSGELCISCGRTKDEIKKWKGMKRPEKKETVQRAAVRLKAIKKKDR